MIVNTEIKLKNKCNNKINNAIYYFWIGFVVYSLSYTIDISGSVNFKICFSLQILGLLLIVPSAIIDANQKIYISNICQFIYSMIYWGGMIIAVSAGGQLTLIGIIALSSAIMWFSLVMMFSRHIWGKLEINGFRKNFIKTAKKQLTYGSKIYLSGLAGYLFEPLSKILLSNFIGVTVVGFYDIALKLRSQLGGFVSKIFYPLFPFISGQKDKTTVRKYVHDFEQKTFLIVVPITAIVILLMHPFIGAWLGKNVNIISITAIVIISFHLIS